MHLNDLCTNSGKFSLNQQQQQQQQQHLQPYQQQLHCQTTNTLQSNANHLIDESTQLNSSLSSSSGGGCTSSSGLGTSSLFSSSSLCSTTTLSNNQNTMNTSSNGSTNGSLINVLLPMSDMNNHNLHRTQLISNLNGSNNQYTTLAFNHHNYSSTSSPSSINTNATSSTLPYNGQQQHAILNSSNNKLTNVYAPNSQTLNDNVYCQTSFNNCAIIDNQLPAHYQLLTNKHHSNYHLPNSLNQNSNYLLQTVPVSQSINYANAATTAATNLPPSINSYINHDNLNKYNTSSQFDLVCDSKLSPVYTKLSPNSNSLIKECLITNANNAHSKFIELASSQNSLSTIYSDTLKSKLNHQNSSKDNLKLMNAANTGLDLLNCDKTFNELFQKNEQLKTDTLNKLDKTKQTSKQSDKKDQTHQLTAKLNSTSSLTDKNGTWCCSKTPSDDRSKQGYCFVVLATILLLVLICFSLSLTSSTARSLLAESGLLPESIRLRLYNETATNKNQFQPDLPSSDTFFTPIRPFLNETIYPLNPRPSLDYSDSLQQHQQQQQGSIDSTYHHNYYQSSPPLARTNNFNNQNNGLDMNNNIPQINPGSSKDEQISSDIFSNSNYKSLEEKIVPKNVTAQAGHMVYLHCIVEAIGDKMVSWIRIRDFYLLTVGTFTYTSDSRFSVRQVSNNDWILQILRLTTHDQGLYECQLNTDPPRSQLYNLIVLVPYAEIENNQNDIEVDPGSPIELTCIIKSSPIAPSFIFWYHEKRMINFDLNNAKARGKIQIYKRNERDDTVISKLVIFNAVSADAGNYTCAPSNAAETSIYVQVLQGEKRLAELTPNNGNQLDRLSSSAPINKPMLIVQLILILSFMSLINRLFSKL